MLIFNRLRAINRGKLQKGNFQSEATNQNTKYATFKAEKIAHTDLIKYWIDEFYLHLVDLKLY